MTAENNWWEYPTNYSGGQEVDGVASFFVKYPNYILSDAFSIGSLVLIFVFSFGISLYAGSRKALAYAGFITLAFAVFFMRIGGTINPVVIMLLIVCIILGLLGGKSEPSY